MRLLRHLCAMFAALSGFALSNSHAAEVSAAPREIVREKTPAAAMLKSEFIFESAPFPQCHASTLAEGKSGLVAAWFGGKRERSPDVGIWLSRFDEGRWTP